MSLESRSVPFRELAKDPDAEDAPGWMDCVVCTDNMITGKKKPGDVRKATTMAPLMQQFETSAGLVMGVVAIPVCRECRREQIGGPRSRLLL